MKKGIFPIVTRAAISFRRGYLETFHHDGQELTIGYDKRTDSRGKAHWYATDISCGLMLDKFDKLKDARDYAKLWVAPILEKWEHTDTADFGRNMIKEQLELIKEYYNVR